MARESQQAVTRNIFFETSEFWDQQIQHHYWVSIVTNYESKKRKKQSTDGIQRIPDDGPLDLGRHPQVPRRAPQRVVPQRQQRPGEQRPRRYQRQERVHEEREEVQRERLAEERRVHQHAQRVELFHRRAREDDERVSARYVAVLVDRGDERVLDRLDAVARWVERVVDARCVLRAVFERPRRAGDERRGEEQPREEDG